MSKGSAISCNWGALEQDWSAGVGTDGKLTGLGSTNLRGTLIHPRAASVYEEKLIHTLNEKGIILQPEQASVFHPIRENCWR